MANKLTTLTQLKKAAARVQTELAEVASAAADALEELAAAKADKAVFGTLSIPTSGWSTDSTVSGYTKYIDITVSGLTANDCVAVTVAPASRVVAQAAQFCSTQSMAGKLRLRAKAVPTAAISASYYIIR